MELAWGAVESEPVPVVNAVGGVGVLLDFVDEETSTDGVDAAGRDVDGVASFCRDGVDAIFCATLAECGFEGFLGGAIFETDVEGCAGGGICDVPHFGFWLAAELGGDVCRGMYLDGEVVSGIEDFDEERETLASQVGAEDCLALVGPELVEGFPLVDAVGDDGLVIWSVAYFPRFSVGEVGGREGATINALEFSAAPDAFLVDGGESDGKNIHG